MSPGERPDPGTVVVRPRKTMIVAWVCAVAVFALFVVVAVLLRTADTGVRRAAGMPGPLTAAATGTGSCRLVTGPQQTGRGTALLRGHVTGQQSAEERGTGHSSSLPLFLASLAPLRFSFVG